ACAVGSARTVGAIGTLGLAADMLGLAAVVRLAPALVATDLIGGILLVAVDPLAQLAYVALRFRAGLDTCALQRLLRHVQQDVRHEFRGEVGTATNRSCTFCHNILLLHE